MKSTFAPSTWAAKTFASGTWDGVGTISPILPFGGSGGQIFDMQSIMVTDQILDFPDWVYQIPVAETLPVIPSVVLNGRINSHIVPGNGGTAIAGDSMQWDETLPIPVETFPDPQSIVVRRQTKVSGRTLNGRTVQGKVRK